MKKVFIAILLCLCGQTFASDPFLDAYAFQVKQIEEFMQRINGEIGIPTPGTDSVDYRTNALFLFDKETYYAHQEDVDKFIDKLSSCHPHLQFTDTTWVAVAKTVVSYSGKADTLELTLKTERVEKNIYKWVISNVSWQKLQLNPQKRNAGLSISPTDNEMRFMSLSSITNREYPNILNYADNQFKVDELSVFYTLIYTNKLKIVEVADLRYVFYDIAGYYLCVKYVSDFNHAHAGWLIHDIHPNN